MTTIDETAKPVQIRVEGTVIPHVRLYAIAALSLNPQRWTPLLLGLAWGLMPCGFLYAAQLKAAETTNLWRGGATMLAFGVGTLPMMLGVGVSTAWVSADRRGQLFRLGGWITLLIGLLTLFRNSDMVDFTGHGALVCLLLALVARPLSRLWSPLLVYRRALGVGAFVLSVAHVAHMLTMGWNLAALPFLLPGLQAGGWAGIAVLPSSSLSEAELTTEFAILPVADFRYRSLSPEHSNEKDEIGGH